MPTQDPITLHLAADEFVLIETALQDHEDTLRHEAQMEQDLTKDEARSNNFLTEADQVSAL
ncbi:hypothetical protein, partial [Agrococcus terreus]